MAVEMIIYIFSNPPFWTAGSFVEVGGTNHVDETQRYFVTAGPFAQLVHAPLQLFVADPTQVIACVDQGDGAVPGSLVPPVVQNALKTPIAPPAGIKTRAAHRPKMRRSVPGPSTLGELSRGCLAPIFHLSRAAGGML